MDVPSATLWAQPSVGLVRKESILIHDGFKEAITRIVMDNVPESTGQRYIVDRSSKYGYQNLPSKIEAIYIKNVTGRMDEGLWYAGISTKVEAAVGGECDPAHRLQNSKLEHYNHSCKKTWLIIIQNSFLMSSQYDAQSAYRALHHHYVSLLTRYSSLSEVKVWSQSCLLFILVLNRRSYFLNNVLL